MVAKKSVNGPGPLANKRALIFIPQHNSEGKKDVTYAFAPEAEAFAKLCASRSEIVSFDNSKDYTRRRKQILDVLSERAEGVVFDTVAFFCHGWGNGTQAGFMKPHAHTLARAILDVVGNDENVVVPLYCCSTGNDPDEDPITAAGTGDDSFADKLRDALCIERAVNCRVMAHTTVAHTTSNPMVLFMDGMGSTVGGVGGYPPVSPKAGKLWNAWKKSLRDRSANTLRFRMPFMTVAEIHEELAG